MLSARPYRPTIHKQSSAQPTARSIKLLTRTGTSLRLGCHPAHCRGRVEPHLSTGRRRRRRPRLTMCSTGVTYTRLFRPRAAPAAPWTAATAARVTRAGPVELSDVAPDGDAFGFVGADQTGTLRAPSGGQHTRPVAGDRSDQYRLRKRI